MIIQKYSLASYTKLLIYSKMLTRVGCLYWSQFQRPVMQLCLYILSDRISCTWQVIGLKYTRKVHPSESRVCPLSFWIEWISSAVYFTLLVPLENLCLGVGFFPCRVLFSTQLDSMCSREGHKLTRVFVYHKAKMVTKLDCVEVTGNPLLGR